MPITLAADVQRLYPQLDARIAFDRTIVNVDRANVHLVSSELDRRNDTDYVVVDEKNSKLSCNVLMLTPQYSFCDPVNGYALYRISEH
jgi:hypothetical protein